jgi:hypothetical protein
MLSETELWQKTADEMRPVGEPIIRSEPFIATLVKQGFICDTARRPKGGTIVVWPPNIHPHTQIGLRFEKQETQIWDDYPLYIWTVWKAVRGTLVRVSRAEFDAMPNTSKARWRFECDTCTYLYGDKTLVEAMRRASKPFGVLEKPEVHKWVRSMLAH